MNYLGILELELKFRGFLDITFCTYKYILILILFCSTNILLRLIDTNLGKLGIWYNSEQTINNLIKGLIISGYTDLNLTNESEAIWGKNWRAELFTLMGILCIQDLNLENNVFYWSEHW